MTQNANFIDLCSIVFSRCRDAWKPQSWFNMSNLFMYSTYCCVGERRGWNCLFQRLPFAFNVSISLFFSSEPGPFCVGCFLYMAALLVTSAPSFLCQPCPFCFKFQPCPFVSTLSFCFQLFPFRFNPALFVSTLAFRFNPVLFVLRLPFLVAALSFGLNSSFLFQTLSFTLYPFLSTLSFWFRFFLLGFMEGTVCWSVATNGSVEERESIINCDVYMCASASVRCWSAASNAGGSAGERCWSVGAKQVKEGQV